MKNSAKLYRICLWGGFSEDSLDRQKVDRGWGGWGLKHDRVPAIYTSRAEARKHYEDVRPIEIRELRSPQKRKPHWP